MNYAIIRNGTVENVIVWDGTSDWQAPDGTQVVALEDNPAGIGWTYIDGNFIAPPAPEPDPISPLLQNNPDA